MNLSKVSYSRLGAIILEALIEGRHLIAVAPLSPAVCLIPQHHDSCVLVY
jgi:hypothetical protein